MAVNITAAKAVRVGYNTVRVSYIEKKR